MDEKIVLELKNINKIIGKRHILHDIDITAYSGEILGFLGPNGAGKTTTIKIVTGLISSDSGSVKVCGCDLNKDFENTLSNIGAIVENPELYKYLSGRKNLEQYARLRKNVTKERIDEVTKLVGLSNRINDKVKTYSLGMRQRLGLAQCILHRPSLLILDEPTNGLDPSGIKELRDILKKLAHEEGTCVIVSSHLMSEMELMCDRVAIIQNGKMTGTYTIDELTSSAGSSVTYIFETDSSEEKITEYGIENAEFSENGTFSVELSGDDIRETAAGITEKLVRNGIKVYSVVPQTSKKLEDVFIELTESGGDQIG